LTVILDAEKYVKYTTKTLKYAPVNSQ